MKITCSILITFFLLSSCNKSNSITKLNISFRSDVPILFAQYNLTHGDYYEYYYPSIWPNGGGANFPYTSLEEISNNHYETDSIEMVSGHIGIYTKIDVSALSAGETATFEIIITDEQTGEIKYERKMETTAEYNRELIQL